MDGDNGEMREALENSRGHIQSHTPCESSELHKCMSLAIGHHEHEDEHF